MIDVLPGEPAAPDFGRLQNALIAAGSGCPVIVLDDLHRTSGGALVFAAEHATSELLSFVIRHSCGFVCAALPQPNCERLDLPLMPGTTDDSERAAHCVTVDRCGTGTGISATARAHTIAALAAANSVPEDFTRPGHVVPMRTRPGGVLERPGYAEAAVDIARLAGLHPAGAFAEMVSRIQPDGMAQEPELVRFAAAQGLTVVSLSELAGHRRTVDVQLVRGRDDVVHTKRGPVRTVEFHAAYDDVEVLALVTGEVDGQHDVLVHVHRECFASALLGSAAECECRAALSEATRAIAAEGRGVLIRVRSRSDEGECVTATGSPAINALADEAAHSLDVVCPRRRASECTT